MEPAATRVASSEPRGHAGCDTVPELFRRRTGAATAPSGRHGGCLLLAFHVFGTKEIVLYVVVIIVIIAAIVFFTRRRSLP